MLGVWRFAYRRSMVFWLKPNGFKTLHNQLTFAPYPMLTKRTEMSEIAQKSGERAQHLARVVEMAGGAQEDLAAALGVSQAAVSKWLRRGWFPLPRAQEVETLFGVPRHLTADPRVVAALCPIEFS